MSLDPAIVKFFTDKGYSSAQARGIAAGVSAESANNPSAVNPTSGAMGLGQWLGPRQRELVKRYGDKPTKRQQLEFLHYEFQGGDHGGKSVLAKKDPSAVLESYIRDFMRPAEGYETNSDIQRGREALGLKGGGQASVYERARAATERPAPVGDKGVIEGGKVFTKAAPKPQARILSPSLIQAYNSHAMDDRPSDRAEIDRALKAGEVVLPEGVTLQAPAPRSMMDNLNMGLTAVRQGLQAPMDLLAAPINSVINMVTGSNLTPTPFRDQVTEQVASMGGPTPESERERLVTSTVEGGASALPLIAVAGASPLVAAIETVSGATSGASSEVARQAGAGPVGQLAAGVLGGVGPASVGARIQARAGRNAGRDVRETTQAPKEALIDPDGNLTPDGQEVAAQNGITPDELKQAFGEPPSGAANDSVASQPSARAINDDLPIEVIEPAPPMRANRTEDAAPPPVDEPSPQATAQDAEALPETALARVEQGRELGVDYTRGQATKSFDVQDAEQQLRNSNGPEGEAIRQFTARQIEQVKAASNDFRSAFGDETLSAEQRGNIVQEAVRSLRDAGRRGVDALYKVAADLGGDDLSVIPDGIQMAANKVLIDEGVEPRVKAKLGQELARYGLVGKAEDVATNELQLTKVKLDDGSTVSFYGPPKQLTVANAEDLRKAVNALYKIDDSHLSQSIKPAIDDAVEEAIEALSAATGQRGPEVQKAYERARAAHQQQKQTYAAKDVVQSVVDWKKGAEGVTSAISPEQVMKRALASTSDLKRMKAVLKSSPTPESEAAWRAIQAHGLAKIFDNATTRTVNPAGEATDAISGAKLRSAVKAFGNDKLKILLDAEDYDRMMKLQRTIEDVTIPISGTVNHSNSGNLIMRLLGNVETKVTGAFAAVGAAVGGPAGAAAGGTVGQAVGTAVKARREARAAAETLEGVTNYTPDRARTEVEAVSVDASPAQSSETIKNFIDTYKSERLLAPIIAAGPQGEEE